ncbi:armadillo repeat-containing protein 7-like [Dermacentor variabilis]|uniref:armadillo repeat-containing protein 7-like n=1 Tax=Dermacentor variabilis TaxID=34621 RepID=UPI003F5AF975
MARYDPKERFRYLKELVNEFHTSCSSEAKEQVLANLANFAYDPANYDHFKRLNILNLFVDQLDSANDNLREFAIGGICNLSSDQDFRAEVLKPDNLSKLISCLSTSQEETVLSTITTLISLGLSGCQTDITTASVIDCMVRYSESPNTRLSNLAKLFLEDICSPEQVSSVTNATAATAVP